MNCRYQNTFFSGEAVPNLMLQEEARLRVLEDLELLDSPETESFDRITRMAGRFFHAPVSAISLTDRSRQWFKSNVGAPGREIPRDGAPCSVVTGSGIPVVVPDLLLDARFSNSLLARIGMRFYAGVPLITSGGYVLGSMCVLDRQPRNLSPQELASLHDFAAMVMAQIELQREIGRIDPLSGLPNRHQMTEDLEDLERDFPERMRVTILIDLIDPRQFNQLVSVLGTNYIDDLIKASVRAITETLGDRKGLYHIGIASFAVLLDGIAGPVWSDLVEALSMRLKVPVLCNGIPVMMTPIFGISPLHPGGTAARDILRTVVSAAHDAREAETEYAVYSPASDAENHRRFTLLTDLRNALVQPDELTLVYQPRVDVRTKACVSAEALLRWSSPRLGNIAPGEFIPLVVQTALAGPLTQWVAEAAFRQVAQWHTSDPDMRVSINISAVNLEQPDFARSLGAALTRHGVPASSIELEFTEGALIRHYSRVLGQLHEVRSMGIELSIDDFGTGYSSFSYLQELPVNTVKLDRSFISDLETNGKNQVLVRSMIAMAHDLGFRVVAEGVETEATFDILDGYSCDEVQGYLIARPLTVPAFDSWIRENRSQGAAIRKSNTKKTGARKIDAPKMDAPKALPASV